MTQDEIYSSAAPFMRALGERHTFQTFGDHDKSIPPQILHGTFDECFEALYDLNRSGSGIYVTVNETDGTGRNASNIVAVRAFFIDIDNGQLPSSWHVMPSIINSRDDKHHQAYWLVSECPLTDFAAIQSRLIHYYKSDPKIKDLPRVMRIPGFVHQKDPASPKQYQTEWIDEDICYTVDEVLDGLPELPKPRAEPVQYQPPADNAAREAERWLSHVPTPTEGNRNDALMRKAHAFLLRFGSRVDQATLCNMLTAWILPSGLDASEVRKTLESVCKRSDRFGDAGSKTRQPVAYAASDDPAMDASIDKWLDGSGKAGKKSGEWPDDVPQLYTFGELLDQFPKLRPQIIHGIMRRGETINIVAGSKSHKSFFVHNLAICLASGQRFMDEIVVERSNVLIFDNELHKETLAHRGMRVSKSLGIDFDSFKDQIGLVPLRGKLKDITKLNYILSFYMAKKHYDVVVLDAFYRFMPKGLNENDNAEIADIFNHLDALAEKYDCSFIVVHHFAKGSQQGKKNTDLGAGAGAFTRACDTHWTIMPHPELDNVCILDASLRSFAPYAKVCLRWDSERLIYEIDTNIDPEPETDDMPRKKAVTFTPQQFAKKFCNSRDLPLSENQIKCAAADAGMSVSAADKMFDMCVGVHIMKILGAKPADTLYYRTS